MSTSQNLLQLVDHHGNPIHSPKEPSFSTLLSQATSLLSLFIAYAFFLSVMHTLTFFSIIRLNPLHVPLSFSDYIIEFCVWVYPALYLFTAIALALLVTHVKKSLRKTVLIYTLHSVMLLAIFQASIALLNVLAIANAINLFVVAIIMYVFVVKNFFISSKTTTRDVFFVLLLVLTFAVCIYFRFEVNNSLSKVQERKQTFKIEADTLEGYYLRAFEKGSLVLTCTKNTPTLFFLPHKKDERILRFPTSMTCPS